MNMEAHGSRETEMLTRWSRVLSENSPEAVKLVDEKDLLDQIPRWLGGGAATGIVVACARWFLSSNYRYKAIMDRLDHQSDLLEELKNDMAGKTESDAEVRERLAVVETKVGLN